MGVKLRLRLAADYLRRREVRVLTAQVRRALYSDEVSLGIRKDLTAAPASAERKPAPSIRPATLDDILSMVADDPDESANRDELHERRWRRRAALTMGVQGCYVADVEGVGPAFMQYLFSSDDNAKLRATFRGAFPTLGPTEDLVEYLYVVPSARHPGLAVSCVAQVAEEARRGGATSVISFIDPTNKGAMFVSQMTGFRAYCVRRCRSRFFRRTYTFEDWPAGVSRALISLMNGQVTIR